MLKRNKGLLQLRSLAPAALALVFAFTGTTRAETDNTDIRKLMSNASQNLSTLIPLAYDDEAFRAGQNRQRIQQAMKELETLFAQKSDKLGDQSDTAWISLQVLQQHLNETAQLYNAGYFAMSQYLLTSTPAICATCHLQDSAHSSIKSQLSRQHFANDYSFAEYLFTIRQYDEAETFYRSHLQDAEVRNSRFRYLKPMERLMTIELGIRQSVEDTGKMLERHLGDTRQIEIKQVLSEWLEGLTAIKTAGAKNHKELQALFNQWFSETPGTSHEFILDESRRPQAIWLRAKLFDLLPLEKSRADNAGILYMLAIIDRVLGQDEPYSFANLYLKQCVVRYPETETATRCLDEYRNHLSFYYGGSAGEAVPEELVEEYRTMKKALQEAR